jgi:pimeloyl-ACP methyl ester carboxylesterase
MTPTEPHVREAGAGAPVVCLHSNASSSSQWRGLMELLSPTHHVLAPDSYGSGKSPDWPSARSITLADEVTLLAPLLARLQPPVTLVDHSYGAAVALKAALTSALPLRALVLYESTLFSLIDAATPQPNDADGIRQAVAAASAALDRGDRDAAACAFIDYWMGPGSWAATPAQRRQPIADSVANVRRWAHALFTEPTPVEAFGRLDIPVLYMIGKRSTASARGVAQRLIPALRRVQVLELDALGHMGPITHPELVNAEIRHFLERIGTEHAGRGSGGSA